MNEISTKEKEFKDLVHVIREQQVMLDSDLAKLYGTEVKNLNRQVKRNIDKFPSDFMFQLTKKETDYLVKCQNGTTLNNFRAGNEGGRRTLPYVFTEQGVYMIATILKNEIATQQSIYIMRSFKEMKHYLIENTQLLNSDVIIFTANKGKPKLQKTEINNFCAEYPSLLIKQANTFHDRYIILDYDTNDEIMYHCGHSSKDSGNKISTIHKMLDTQVMHPIIDDLLEKENFLFK